MSHFIVESINIEKDDRTLTYSVLSMMSLNFLLIKMNEKDMIHHLEA